jgi:hypothetical protein
VVSNAELVVFASGLMALVPMEISQDRRETMSQITRREVIAATLTGSVIAAVPPSARAEKTDDKLEKLLQAMEGFRTKIPPPQGLGEMNGKVLKSLEPCTDTHLSGVAERLRVKSRAECLVLLTYLNDPNPQLRFIAVHAIYKVVDGYRNGIDSGADNILDTRSAGHLKMVRRFVELINKLKA